MVTSQQLTVMSSVRNIFSSLPREPPEAGWRSPAASGEDGGGALASPLDVYLDGESLMPETLMRIDVEHRVVCARVRVRACVCACA